MAVALDLSALRKTGWKDYVLRFVFGGCIAVVVTLISHHFGSALGGLFLGFPAILPATLTLVKEHDGRAKAADDAAGAASGAVGLIAFAGCIWLSAARLPVPLVLGLATLIWLVVALACWWICQRLRLLR